MVHVKICGITTIDDARACADLGASAIGLNFVPTSKRRISVEAARAISAALDGTKVLVVGVVADLDLPALRALVRDAGLGCLQLHGRETPEDLVPLLPHAYKAIAIANAHDVAMASRYGGDHLLVDAKVEGQLGGTGNTFDWHLVTELGKTRKLTLAGGLRPDNVAEAVRIVRPWCVDVASGVEHAPGAKDHEAVRAFIAAARSAS